MRFWFAPIVICGCAHLHTPPGPALPDRPGFTDTPAVLPPGAIQVEAGYTDDRLNDNRYQSAGEVLLRVGIGGPVELRLFGNSYATHSSPNVATVHGFEDFKLGVKVRLIEKPDSVHGLKPNLALLIATTFPTGASKIGAGVVQPEVKVAASWTTNSPFSVYSNAGFGTIFDGTAWSNHTWGSVATWYAVTPRISMFVEGLHVRTVSGPSSPTSYIDGGVTLLFGERFQIDVRAGRGVGSPVSAERFIGLGLARRF